MGLNPVIFGQNRNPIVGGSLDPVVTDWVARTIAAGGSVATSTQTAIDNFVKGCKSDNIWNVMQSGLILPLASNGFDGFTVPLIIPAGKSVTPNNFTSANYSLSKGLDFITNTTNRRISSDLIASDLMTASSSQCSAYVRVVRAGNSNSTFSFEVSPMTSRILYSIARSSGQNLIDFYNSGSRHLLSSNTGLWSSGVLNTAFTTYRNGTQLATRIVGGTFPASAQMQIGRFGVTVGDSCCYGYFYVGAALTAAQEALHHNRVQDLQTALGRAV